MCDCQSIVRRDAGITNAHNSVVATILVWETGCCSQKNAFPDRVRDSIRHIVMCRAEVVSKAEIMVDAYGHHICEALVNDMNSGRTHSHAAQDITNSNHHIGIIRSYLRRRRNRHQRAPAKDAVNKRKPYAAERNSTTRNSRLQAEEDAVDERRTRRICSRAGGSI